MALKLIFNPFDKALQYIQDETDLQELAFDRSGLLANDAANAFREAINGSLSNFALIDGIIDDYQDQSGISSKTAIFFNSALKYFTDGFSLFLLHCNGANGSTTFTDSSPFARTVTPVNNAQISTSQSVFGEASGLFDGAEDYLSIPESSDLDFNDDDFTLDFRMRFNSIGSPEVDIFGQTDATQGWRIQYITASNSLRFIMTTDITSSETAAFTINFSINTWYHIRFIRSENTLRLYVDGTNVGGDKTLTKNLPHIVAPLEIGRQSSNPVEFDGYLDEILLYKGNLSTGNFVSPTNEYGLPTIKELISGTFITDSVPTESTLIIRKEDIDSITLNTDLKAYISRNNGTTFTEVTLVEAFDFQVGQNILTGTLTFDTEPSGTSMVYKIEVLNSKQINLHSAALFWQ